MSIRLSSMEENERTLDLEGKFDKISQAVDQLQSVPNGDISLSPPLSRTLYCEDRRLRPKDHPQGASIGYTPRSTNTLAVSAAAVQDKFKSIRDKYATIEIPEQFKMSIDRTGVRKDDQSKINLIANCANFSEALLRLSLSGENDSETIKHQVFSIAAAQQKVLQTYYSVIIVDNSFNSQKPSFINN